MIGKWLFLSGIAAALVVPPAIQAQTPMSTAFTYQGQLKQAGAPVNDTADGQFSLWDAAADGSQVGTTVTVSDLVVMGGQFIAQLDFGAAAFSGQARWLEVAVRVPHDPTDTAPYTTLTPRHELTAVPYARFAAAPWTTAGSNISFTGGNVGIGTTSPGAKLDVEWSSGIGVFAGNLDPFGTALFETNITTPATTHVWFAENGQRVFSVTAGGAGYFAGRVGIGTAGPSAPLHVYEAGTGPAWRGRGVFSGQTSAAIIGEYDGKAVVGAHNAALNAWADLHINQHGGNVGIGLGSATPQTRLDVNGAITIRGADVAEKFPVTGEVKPGMVMAIDPDHPGKLCLARGAYNRCVAGIVSGANGLSAGAILGNSPEDKDAPPIALSGRVWCYVDASTGPVAPGDLLTTSDTPGHAMKVADHARAQGAVLGKAMTPLKEGCGLVLVLVSLQ